MFCSPAEAFEELERALSAAQRAEEARKQLQVQLDERMKEVERASEEERKSLQQELTRVKQEVVSIMKVRHSGHQIKIKSIFIYTALFINVNTKCCTGEKYIKKICCYKKVNNFLIICAITFLLTEIIRGNGVKLGKDAQRSFGC